jgi:hypothetical protein
MARYLPFAVAVACCGLMIVTRLLTNRHVRSHRTAIADAGTAVGAIPPLFSALYLIGLAGLTVSAIWAFVAVAWWGTLVVIAFYLLTGLVRSELSTRT